MVEGRTRQSRKFIGGRIDNEKVSFWSAHWTNLACRWTRSDQRRLLSPAVANGVVYVGSADDSLYALNASTGALLWKYRTNNYVVSSPTVANGVVYIESVDGNLYALNASTGELLWSDQIGNLVYSSPTVINGVLYVGSDNHNVYAFHLPGN